MFEWQALSNFFIAIAVGVFLATMAQFVSLDLVIQINPKSEDMAAALFYCDMGGTVGSYCPNDDTI